jgi:hypothetical protein
VCVFISACSSDGLSGRRNGSGIVGLVGSRSGRFTELLLDGTRAELDDIRMA